MYTVMSGYNPFDPYGDLNELHLIANVNITLLCWFLLIRVQKCILSQIELVKFNFDDDFWQSVSQEGDWVNKSVTCCRSWVNKSDWLSELSEQECDWLSELSEQVWLTVGAEWTRVWLTVGAEWTRVWLTVGAEWTEGDWLSELSEQRVTDCRSWVNKVTECQSWVSKANGGLSRPSNLSQDYLATECQSWVKKMTVCCCLLAPRTSVCIPSAAKDLIQGLIVKNPAQVKSTYLLAFHVCVYSAFPLHSFSRLRGFR
jgi:hypothetical protein